MPFTIVLGKDVTISGVANARSVTVSSSASEIDVTKFGDTARKFRRGLIEQTVEVECIDSPGVSAGGTFTLGGTETGDSESQLGALKKRQNRACEEQETGARHSGGSHGSLAMKE